MNFLNANRVATYFGDVVNFETPKASAVFHLEQLSQNFDFTQAGLGVLRLRPSIVIELDDLCKIKSKLVITTFEDGKIPKDTITRFISEPFYYRSDKAPIKHADYECFKKTLNKILHNIDFGNVYEIEISKFTELKVSTMQATALVSFVQQMTNLLKPFSDIDYHSSETFIDSLSLAINSAVGIFEPTIVLVCDDKKSKFTLPLENGHKLTFGLIPVYKDGGWLCYTPHTVNDFVSCFIYEPEIDLIPFDKLNKEQVLAYNFHRTYGIFTFLNRFIMQIDSGVEYNHDFTETLRIFTYNVQADLFMNEIKEAREYPYSV